MIVLQPPPLCEGWGGRPLCVSGDSSVLMDLHWACDCTAHECKKAKRSVYLAVPRAEFVFEYLPFYVRLAQGILVSPCLYLQKSKIRVGPVNFVYSQ